VEALAPALIESRPSLNSRCVSGRAHFKISFADFAALKMLSVLIPEDGGLSVFLIRGECSS
jgi:hypothetical protein